MSPVHRGMARTLTLTSSSLRFDPDATTDYARGAENVRFRDELRAVSIATSVGQNDAGLFEVSSQDPRYLPFERREDVGTPASCWLGSIRWCNTRTISISPEGVAR